MNVSRLVWQHRKMSPVKHNNLMTTLNGGSLGSCIDEERSQLRYVMWIAEFSESSNLWTQIALSGTPGSMSAWVSFKPILDHGVLNHRLGRRWGPLVSFDRSTFKDRDAPPHMTFTVMRLDLLTSQQLVCCACVVLWNLFRLKHSQLEVIANEPLQWRASQSKPIYTMTSDQSRLPAEFKHINKRRKRKQQWLP